jgi:hypothetical protein
MATAALVASYLEGIERGLENEAQWSTATMLTAALDFTVAALQGRGTSVIIDLAEALDVVADRDFEQWMQAKSQAVDLISDSAVKEKLRGIFKGFFDFDGTAEPLEV